jgi:Mg2+ and Co2+ transporter CorA
VRDLLDPRPIPRLDNYGAYLQFSLCVSPHALRTGPDETLDEAPAAGPDASRLDFLVGSNWVVTVHDADLQFLRGFRGQDKAETEIGALSAAALTASLLDWHLESFFAEVARIELAVDGLDERVLSDPTGKLILGRILAVRRRSSRLRRLLVVQRPIFYGLGRPDLIQSVLQGEAEHFQALATRFERAVDEVEHTRDLVVGSFELFTSRSAQQTNELVKALTFFTVIIGITAAVAGLFGMNFDPPFFKSGATGFFAVTGGLATLGIGAWVLGRRRGWI